MNKGGVFIISGPSGSGKDTVMTELFKKMPELLFSISSITRAMRPGEREGEKYNLNTTSSWATTTVPPASRLKELLLTGRIW